MTALDLAFVLFVAGVLLGALARGKTAALIVAICWISAAIALNIHLFYGI